MELEQECRDKNKGFTKGESGLDSPFLKRINDFAEIRINKNDEFAENERNEIDDFVDDI